MIYRNLKAKAVGLTPTAIRMILDDIWSDLTFYGIEARTPGQIFEELNELCFENQKFSQAEIDVLALEMCLDNRFQFYFYKMNEPIDSCA